LSNEEVVDIRVGLELDGVCDLTKLDCATVRPYDADAEQLPARVYDDATAVAMPPAEAETGGMGAAVNAAVVVALKPQPDWTATALVINFAQVLRARGWVDWIAERANASTVRRVLLFNFVARALRLCNALVSHLPPDASWVASLWPEALTDLLAAYPTWLRWVVV
jgi:uncharacterized membrane protein